MENSLNIPVTMVFNPVAFALAPGVTQVVDMEFDTIALVGAPPPMAGPYIGEADFEDVYGMWLGPDQEPEGYTIEFSVVGPYPPAKQKTESSNTSNKVGSKVKWKRVNFKQLSLKELECAEKRLNEAKSKYKDNEEGLKLLKSWLEEVLDAKKEREAEGEGSASAS